MRRLSVALGCVALAVAFTVGPASARTAAPTANLIKNGGAELGSAVSNDTGVVAAIPGWTRTGGFTVVKYGSPGGFPDASVATAIHGGKNFFAGGPANPDSGATQTISVLRLAAAIDQGGLSATLSGDLGGYSSQHDSLTVVATFLDGSGVSLGAIHIGPVTAAQRKSTTGLIVRTFRARLHPKTRTVASSSGRCVRTAPTTTATPTT